MGGLPIRGPDTEQLQSGHVSRPGPDRRRDHQQLAAHQCCADPGRRAGPDAHRPLLRYRLHSTEVEDPGVGARADPDPIQRRYRAARFALPTFLGPVAGAAGYWIQVFQYQGASTAEAVFNGLPSPLAVGHLVDLFAAYVPAPDTSYKLGSGGVEILAKKIIVVSGAYLVRIAAVDANGRLVAFSYGDPGLAIGTTTYVVFPLGAFVVEPMRPKTAPAGVKALTFGPLNPSGPIVGRLTPAR